MGNLPETINVQGASLPASYEAAKQALANCSSLDECKDWSDKASALASYAKMADDDDLEKYAIKIRSQAIRRCGELLKQFDGSTRAGGVATDTTQRQAAQDAGLSKRQQVTAVRVANVPQDIFDAAVEGDEKTTVTKLADMGKKSAPHNPYPDAPPAPPGFIMATNAIGSVNRLSEFCHENDPVHVAGGVLNYEVTDLKTKISIIDNWLDRFVANLKEPA
ncbi:MAG: hypothetical protein GY862_28205 [Gammaproteobacteria bacterium]|nr:hypothetical protein [Gammaproteobacteria bacterium]